MKKILVPSALLVAFGLAAFGAAQSNKVTLNYYSFTTDANHVKTLDGLIDTFQRENPGIEVKYTTAPFDSYFTKLQTDIAAGQAPDVFELNYENFTTFAARGTLLELGSRLAAEKTPVAKTFYPAALNAFRSGGTQYGLPITFSTVVLFYNKDLFDKAGVAYPNANWTWKDELEAAKKLTDPSKRVWGVFQPVQFWEFYKVAAQAGGAIRVSPNVTIDTSRNREALRWLTEKTLVHKVMPSAAEMSGADDGAMFVNGQLAMLHTGIWMFDAFSKAKFNWDIAVEPGNVKKATHFFSNAAVVSRSSKNADAAYRWVKFLAASPATVKARIDTSWELPALSLDQKSLLQGYLAKPQPANREAVFESLRYAVTPPVMDRQSQLQDIINQELEAARLGTKTVEAALGSAQRRVSDLMKR
jgi:multiple sugar transport system substrate-binding protein